MAPSRVLEKQLIDQEIETQKQRKEKKKACVVGGFLTFPRM